MSDITVYLHSNRDYLITVNPVFWYAMEINKISDNGSVYSYPIKETFQRFFLATLWIEYTKS